MTTPEGPGRSTPSAAPYRLALVGGGPRATYVLERLSATVGRLGPGRGLEVRVFERTGEFGAGYAHSPTQVRTSYLNRISSQVSFAADETVVGAGPLRPAAQRPTLHEWCRRRFTETGDPDFDLGPEDWPRRYVHGLALRDMFDVYAADLRRHAGAELHLHRAEVADVEPHGAELRVVTADGSRYPADEVLLLTGHSYHDARRSPAGRLLAGLAAGSATRHVPHPYPMDVELDLVSCGPQAVVGCAGMGLTAIDTILHLTEGRGGTFAEDDGGGLVYRPSGAEPAGIVAFSGSGLFTFARPDNHKPSDGSGDHPGTFLTHEAIRRLRAGVGRPYPESGTGRQAQLDFEQDVLPLVVLEMAHLYYVTLFGPGAALLLTQRALPVYLAFLAGTLDYGDGPERLLGPLERAVDEVTEVLESVMRGTVPVEVVQKSVSWPVRDVLLHWAGTVFGTSAAREVGRCLDRASAPKVVLDGLGSPSALDTGIGGNRFSWRRAVQPVGPRHGSAGFGAEVRDFMARDQKWARQGNLRNPHKAASDGVWRDLRSVISYAVDDAGLTAASQRVFLERYVRHHNRLANGAAPEIMAKIMALMDHGLLDVGAGPAARLSLDERTDRVVVEGVHHAFSRAVDVLVDARIHAFDPEADVLPLYRNLLGRGTVRLWRNAAADGGDFYPGGLDLTPAFHPIRSDGSAEPRITVLGVPSEGARSFLLSALRPNANHYVMRDVLVWLDGFWRALGDGGNRISH
ncbi:FAD/NAD(P)-binding protein [Streptomyces brevispora]|uniref:FAD/NAD(P)-binding protein n=1 Tax=Streptomyces brevispora TaxID=887462 RepID=A0ABZ1G010_9ACTN|nr:FAD/NAD(P)-binding protein [Streptomyces brevispora]WSC13195.1 FAD/NAD(P)-binding protein [Streptomyces brevispora]